MPKVVITAKQGWYPDPDGEDTALQGVTRILGINVVPGHLAETLRRNDPTNSHGMTAMQVVVNFVEAHPGASENFPDIWVEVFGITNPNRKATEADIRDDIVFGISEYLRGVHRQDDSAPVPQVDVDFTLTGGCGASIGRDLFVQSVWPNPAAG